ncbi:hypothetical protein BVRB_3g050130 [Beta vulgaris subsp. vulgaris]|nr:hypothetical protein BVRB_3g050130 [Beta vulgaris subsp. vulgaris]
MNFILNRVNNFLIVYFSLVAYPVDRSLNLYILD